MNKFRNMEPFIFDRTDGFKIVIGFKNEDITTSGIKKINCLRESMKRLNFLIRTLRITN